MAQSNDKILEANVLQLCFNEVHRKQPLPFQRAGRAERMMSDVRTAGDAHEFDPVASKKQPCLDNNELLFHLEPQEDFLQRVPDLSFGELLQTFAASDANGGSSGGREGHLGAAVVVQFACARAAYHPRVGVRAPVRVSVPETPDVALWAHRWKRLEDRILTMGS